MLFGIPQYVQCILHGLTTVLFCVPFIFAEIESVDLVVAHDGFLCIMEIIRILHSGYFDHRCAYQSVLDLYCCVIVLSDSGD